MILRFEFTIRVYIIYFMSCLKSVFDNIGEDLCGIFQIYVLPSPSIMPRSSIRARMPNPRGEQKKTEKLIKLRKPEKKPKKPIKLIKIFKKPVGSVWFRFYKKKTEKTKPNRTETKKKPSQNQAKPEKPSQIQENRAKTGKTEPNRFEPGFALKNQTEPNQNWSV